MSVLKEGKLGNEHGTKHFYCLAIFRELILVTKLASNMQLTESKL